MCMCTHVLAHVQFETCCVGLLSIDLQIVENIFHEIMVCVNLSPSTPILERENEWEIK